MKPTVKRLNAGFVLALLAFFLLGLGKAVLRPKEVNTYENRGAHQLEAPALSTVLDGSFQDSVEDALSDQVPLAQVMKKIYNEGGSRLVLGAMSGFLETKPPYYVSLLGTKLFAGDYLVYDTYTMERVAENLGKKADNLNAQFAAHPELDFYAYYIEKDTDVNLETGEKPGIYEALAQKLELPEDHAARFQVDGFEDFGRDFFRTDHHWNQVGSYRGYREVLNLLGVSDAPLAPLGEETVAEDFSGSKAGSAGMRGVFTEGFAAYRFDFPEMEITVNGEPAGDYGNQEAYLNGTAAEPLSYGNFYGGDFGEVIFDTGREDRENLLVVGESFDNAILKLLASHFGRTYSVDLRNYEQAMGSAFAFSPYVEQNQIGTVLLIGNCDYYTMPEFMLEG